MWHKHLSELEETDFKNGNLWNMGNSKDVYKTIKFESSKKSCMDKDMVTSVMKLKAHYDKISTRKVIKDVFF